MGERKAVSPMRVRPGEFTRPFIDVGGKPRIRIEERGGYLPVVLANVEELCWKVGKKEPKE